MISVMAEPRINRRRVAGSQASVVMALSCILGASLPLAVSHDARAEPVPVTAAKLKREPVAKSPSPSAPPSAPALPVPAPATSLPPAAAPAIVPPERIEADVSARSIAVTAAYKGSEVTVFGSVDNSRQPSPESGYYDVIVAVEGAPAPTIVRRKSNVAGLWVNTASARFDRTPTYYAVASTRPLEEIAESDVLAQNGIGLENIPLSASSGTLRSTRASELRDFQDALGRLKVREGLFTRDDYGVTFSGRSLFRSTLALPANVPVGQLVTRVYLFREGKLLNRFTTRVGLERTGIERFIYDTAHSSSWLYGIFAVLVAVMCGLIASAVLGRSPN